MSSVDCDNDAIVLSLPGVASASDIDLDVVDGVLYIVTEYHQRRVELPYGTDADNIRAKFDIATSTLTVATTAATRMSPPTHRKEAWQVVSIGDGSRAVAATRAIKRGEMIVFEEPEALLKGGELPEGAPEGVTPEWLLARLLLQQGKRSSWAKQYVCDELHDADGTAETSALVAWIRQGGIA